MGAFLEVFGQTQRISAADHQRLRTRITSTRELCLLDLENAKTQKAFGLDARIASAMEYDTTQAWSRAWHDWYPEVDGIQCLSRHANVTLNLSLFLDRCGTSLVVGQSMEIGAVDPAELLALIVPYGIVIDF